jgi:hypothetical protein
MHEARDGGGEADERKTREGTGGGGVLRHDGALDR